jgi:CBS domain-containing protein
VHETPVERLMSRPVETVSPETRLHEAADRMVRDDVSALVVVDDGHVGLVCATDVVRVVRAGEASTDPRVRELAASELLTTTPDTSVAAAAAAMVERRVHHLPVVADGALVGMVTTMDVAAVVARS